MSHKNCGWHDMIECTAQCCQSEFSMSKILGQLSDYNDILNRQTQTMRTISSERLASLEKIR